MNFFVKYSTRWQLPLGNEGVVTGVIDSLYCAII